MATISNSYLQKSMIEEMNSIVLELVQTLKKFVYKYHKFIGYF